MPIVTDAAFILPDDFADAALMGRIWRPDLASPSVVAIRPDGVFDITGNFPTASQLAEVADPAAALRAARGERRAAGTADQHAARQARSNDRWLLAPMIYMSPRLLESRSQCRCWSE
jgi:fumarylacetoacetate (FAA) hydrolase family protein